MLIRLWLICSDYSLDGHKEFYSIAGSTHWAHLARPVRARDRTHKVRNFWTMSAIKSQQAAEDSQNRESIKDFRGIIVLQTQLAFFPGFRNNKLFLILAMQWNPLLTMLVRWGWPDISLVSLLHFYGTRLRVGP